MKNRNRKQKQPKKLPVTILSGFLGAGKTTLLSNILSNKHGLRVAVIVNDMSELNIDAKLIKNGSFLSQVEEKMVEMQNGCICCTLREDLLIEIQRLALLRKFDYLLIEGTGISEPLQVAETFTFEDIEGNTLSNYARLDTCVTVVDANNFFRNLKSVLKVKDTPEKAGPDDERTIAHLLIDQVEFADVILINKIDLVSEEELATITSTIKVLNPEAQLFKTQNSKIDLKKVLNTKLFDFDKAQTNPGWLREMRGQHIPETIEYGVTSFVYRRRKPFHPQKLCDLLEKSETTLPSVIRSKGFAWIASKNNYCAEWSSAGNVYKMAPDSLWFTELPKNEWPDDDPNFWVDFDKDSPYGDRRQEIVIIGVKMDHKAVEMILDGCLLTDQEYEEGPEMWSELKDGYGDWNLEDDRDHDEDGEWEDEEEEGEENKEEEEEK